MTPDPVPVFAEVTHRAILEEVPVSATVRFGDVPNLGSEATGVIREWFVDAGDIILDGDPVFLVDGVVRMAIASDRPFWRALRSGNTGEDVVELEEALVRFGLLEAADETFGFDTSQAVRGLAETLGVARPDGSFDPAWVVWLPYQPFEVERRLLNVADRVGDQTTPILVGTRSVEGVTFTDLEGSEFASSGVWVLVVDEIEWPVEDGQMSESDMKQLASLVNSETSAATGVLKKSTTLIGFRVPASAIVSGTSGQLCLWRESPRGFDAITVEIVDGGAGTADIVGPLESGDRVLSNPYKILSDASCP